MRRLFSVLILALFSVALFADNTITVSSASGAPGEEVQIDVSLTNSDAVTAAEIRIPLNNYIQYVEGSAVLNTERSDGHQLSAASVNNELRLYIYGFGTKSLKGNSGKLVSFKLKLGKSPEIWNLEPTVVLSNAQGSSIGVSANAGQVTILVPQLTVETHIVDYGHVPIRNTYTQYVTLRNSGTSKLAVNDVTFSADEFSVENNAFTLDAGATRDVMVSYAPTKHGSVDATMTIVSDASNGKQQTSLVADPYSVNELYIGSAEGSTDTEVTINVTLNNMEPIVAAQWSIELPDELRYVDGSVDIGSHASGLKAAASVSGNLLTIFLYSMNNTPIPEGNGSIATFRLLLQGPSGWGYFLDVTNPLLINAKQENMVSATSSGFVTVWGPQISASSSLDIGSSSITEVANASYSISNTGAVPLVINRVTFLAEGFSIAEELPLTIPSYSSESITVQYYGEKEGDYSTTMQVYSNDPMTRMKSVAVSGTLYEPNTISATGEWSDDSYVMTLDMDNYTDIVAAQMDVHLPAGVSISNEALKGTDRLEGLSFIVANLGNDIYRIVIFSLNNTPISGHSGNILSIELNADSPESLSEQTVTINNITLSNATGRNVSSMASCVHVTEKFCKLGDVNNDTNINILDVLGTLSIMKGNTGTFNVKAADANCDSNINILDVLKILETMKNQ